MRLLQDLVKRLVKSFESEGLEYAFTGALAVSYYGVPRTTVDVDVIVYLPEECKSRLVSALKEAGLIFDENEIDRALKTGCRIATFRDSKSPYSIDIILSESRFDRRVGVLENIRIFFQLPEDLVLAKLGMIKTTLPKERALKDKDDVRAVLKFTKLDLEKLRKQAEEEGTIQILEEIIGE